MLRQALPIKLSGCYLWIWNAWRESSANVCFHSIRIGLSRRANWMVFYESRSYRPELSTFSFKIWTVILSGLNSLIPYLNVPIWRSSSNFVRSQQNINHRVRCVNCSCFCPLAAIQWQLMSVFSCIKEYCKSSLPTNLHNFSDGVLWSILKVPAEIRQHTKCIRWDKQNPYFYREVMENIELQLRVRNCLWNIWETPFTPLHKVSFHMGQFGRNINHPKQSYETVYRTQATYAKVHSRQYVKKRCNPPILLKIIVSNQSYAKMLHEFHRNLLNRLWYTRKMIFLRYVE